MQTGKGITWCKGTPGQEEVAAVAEARGGRGEGVRPTGPSARSPAWHPRSTWASRMRARRDAATGRRAEARRWVRIVVGAGEGTLDAVNLAASTSESSSSSSSSADGSADGGDDATMERPSNRERWRSAASAAPAVAKTFREWADSGTVAGRALEGFTARENAALASMDAKQRGDGSTRRALWCSPATLGAAPGAPRVNFRASDAALRCPPR